MALPSMPAAQSKHLTDHHDTRPMSALSTSSSLTATASAQGVASNKGSGTSPMVAPLPNNAIVFHPHKESFPQYIDQQFPGLGDAVSQKPGLETQDHNDVDQDKPDWTQRRPSSWTPILLSMMRPKSLVQKDPESASLWWVADDRDGCFSVGAFLFLFGFICPPCWWIGACWPRRSYRGGKMAERWQQLNRFMSITFSLLLVVALITVGAIYATRST